MGILGLEGDQVVCQYLQYSHYMIYVFFYRFGNPCINCSWFSLLIAKSLDLSLHHAFGKGWLTRYNQRDVSLLVLSEITYPPTLAFGSSDKDLPSS
jgi:hypothetical protein